MSVEMRWYDEAHTILYIKVVGQWTWDDYSTSRNNIAQMGATVEHDFHSISDLTEAISVPMGDILSQIASSLNVNPPNYKLAIWVNAPQILEAAISILNAAITGYPTRIFVDTVDEALAIIANYSQSE